MTRTRFQAGIFAIAGVVGLAGCDGGGGEEPEPERCFETKLANCGSGPWDPFGIALALAWWSGQCTEEVACAADAPQIDLTNGLVSDSYVRSTWTTNTASEREPNDAFDEAMVFLIEDDGAFLVTGMISPEFDPVDTLVFATESFDMHAVYLCAVPDDCALPFYQGDAMYLEFYDENGTLLESTQFAQSENGHEIVFTPSPGLRYYVMLRASESDEGSIDYKLVITD